MRILGIDPGKTTGWAVILMDDSKHLELGPVGNTTDMQLIEIIDEIRQADVIVYEGWWTRPDKAMNGKFNWQGVDPEEVIGSLKTLAKLHQIDKLVKQQPSQRVTGYPWAGLNYRKGKKGMHWQDALAHAVFYAVARLKAFPLGVKPHGRTSDQSH